MEASASLSNIPIDIIRHILLQLSVKSVIRCQCVCKQWLLLIQDDSDFKLSYRGQRRVIILSYESKGGKNKDYRFFVRSTSHDLRLQRHKWAFGEGYPLIRETSLFDVTLCCCNGLLIVVTKRDLLLWNPSTRCLTKVLERPYPEGTQEFILAGLCYDSGNRDYKVVLLFHRYWGYSLVISASLNHKEWRPVEFPYYGLRSIRGGVNFRNTFHWWGVSEINHKDPGNKIIYFDPALDKFRILPTPGRENLIVGLGVIDDCLCMAQEDEPNSTNKIQVFIMKEYGRQESWMTAFAIQIPELTETYGRYQFTLTFYSLKKNAQEVFLSISDAYGCQFQYPSKYQVYVYDRKKDELKEILMNFLDSYRRNIVGMCFYVESLDCPSHNGFLAQ
nr:F-box/kelch-repeat protein At3g23880-like [Ipomoea batatas]